eukprot:CAMPEP_0185771758 /NCGR_PEP_ID=MMETSP1174-20130828/65001_1 /TAXON_ID=35687 /ORGANISM="Dictyocha speculum, Strain CCMP1381" /LENGTH=160 /DNA_ID=CAMNT_0028457713 /DNA_START=124 /DNA_END=607 /DNA_ORIENTATION=-
MASGSMIGSPFSFISVFAASDFISSLFARKSAIAERGTHSVSSSSSRKALSDICLAAFTTACAVVADPSTSLRASASLSAASAAETFAAAFGPLYQPSAAAPSDGVWWLSSTCSSPHSHSDPGEALRCGSSCSPTSPVLRLVWRPLLQSIPPSSVRGPSG